MRRFNKGFSLSALMLITLLAGPMALAQQSTERYIPIGFSPGISNVSSFIGEVVSVDESAQTFSLQVGDAARTLRVSSETRIWLDRTLVRKTNVVGSFGDIRPGRVIEVNYDVENPEMAVWVKIQAI